MPNRRQSPAATVAREAAMFVPLSVLEFRDRAAMFFGDKIGVVDGDLEFTYRAFATRTHRLANALVELGIAPGDRVSFITFNTHHLLEAYYGVIEAGAVLNPVNIRLAPHEIAYILDHAASRVVFFHRDFTPLIEAILPKLAKRPTLVVLDGDPGGLADHEYEALLASGSPDPLHPNIDENAMAELFYTSGTTGLPKGVAMTHRELYLHAMAAQVGLAFTEDDVVLHVVPLFHVNGWGVPHFLTMIGVRGNTVMDCYYHDPDATAEAIRDGWLHTGDMATIDEAGYVMIKDRSKDIIISAGENISSVEIEVVLGAHPGVLESA